MKLFLGLVLTTVLAFALQAEIPMKSGETVAFMGDSITDMGNWKPGGYLHLVADGLQREGIKINILPAGRGGNRSTQMLARVDADVIAKKPDWMFLSCGVNDVWHGDNGVKLPDYERSMRAIAEKVLAAKIKLIILSPTLIYEEPNSQPNVRMEPYIAALKKIAADNNVLYVDLNTRMRNEIATYPPAMRKLERNVLTTDGVHMNATGNQMMAESILLALGVPQEKVDAARKEWNTLPDAMFLNVKCPMSATEYSALRERANKENLSTQKYLEKEMLRRFKELLQEKP